MLLRDARRWVATGLFGLLSTLCCAGDLRGVVVTETGEPVPGAIVYIEEAPELGRSTNRFGAFELVPPDRVNRFASEEDAARLAALRRFHIVAAKDQYGRGSVVFDTTGQGTGTAEPLRIVLPYEGPRDVHKEFLRLSGAVSVPRLVAFQSEYNQEASVGFFWDMFRPDQMGAYGGKDAWLTFLDHWPLAGTVIVETDVYREMGFRPARKSAPVKEPSGLNRGSLDVDVQADVERIRLHDPDLLWLRHVCRHEDFAKLLFNDLLSDLKGLYHGHGMQGAKQLLFDVRYSQEYVDKVSSENPNANYRAGDAYQSYGDKESPGLLRELRQYTGRVGFQFLVIENHRPGALEDLRIAYRQFDAPAFDENSAPVPAAEAARKLASGSLRELRWPALAPHQSLMIPLGVYLRAADGAPQGYFTSVLRPESLRYRDAESGEIRRQTLQPPDGRPEAAEHLEVPLELSHAG